MREVVDVDPYSGAIETIEWDDAENRLVVKTTCDVQPVIDRNKELANSWDGWVDEAHTMRLAAQIPVTVAYKWLQDYGVMVGRREHWPAIRRLLNDPEWRYLRVGHFIL